jgi:hypothetical protein
MPKRTPRANRIKLTLGVKLAHQLHTAHAAYSEMTPFSRFLVYLLQLGIVQLLTQAKAAQQPPIAATTSPAPPDTQEPETSDYAEEVYAQYEDYIDRVSRENS